MLTESGGNEYDTDGGTPKGRAELIDEGGGIESGGGYKKLGICIDPLNGDTKQTFPFVITELDETLGVIFKTPKILNSKKF